ncbi:OmpA family protein [Paucihalobacter sp.]|uniref:OmpA family protein n=1 Tax=Paucihalobacter sp. TaxID=2850405 RepID=UPI002FE11994
MKRFLIIILLVASYSFSQQKLTHEVYFDTDKFDIPSTELNRLLLFLSQLEDIGIEKISIYGFTDDRGSESYNIKLSQQRADAIKSVFSDSEFDENLITNVDGKGKILLKLIAEDDIHKIRGLNRKVEIIVSPIIEKVEETVEAITKKPEAKDLLRGDVKPGDKILIENLLFKTGYSYLLPESRKVLDDLAEVLVERKDLYFTIQGHVCCTQNTRDALDRKTNKVNLSVARAQFVYDFLAKKGVNPRRMKYVGMRRKMPLGGEAKYDRRVEILITHVMTEN